MVIHPLSGDLSGIKDLELETKIQDLTKKYWQTYNPQVREQIALFIEIYQEELTSRRLKTITQDSQNKNNDLDSLIKVN